MSDFNLLNSITEGGCWEWLAELFVELSENSSPDPWLSKPELWEVGVACASSPGLWWSKPEL